MVHPDRRNRPGPLAAREHQQDVPGLGQPTFLPSLRPFPSAPTCPAGWEFPSRGVAAREGLGYKPGVSQSLSQRQQVPPAGDAAGAEGLGEPAQSLGKGNNPCWGRGRGHGPLWAPSSYRYLLYVLLFSFPGPKSRDFL